SLLGIQSLGLGIIVVGLFRENREVGLFAVALALQGPGGVFLSGIVNIWAPVVSDLYGRGAVDRLESLYQTITRWIATFSFPVYAALIIEPDFFVRFFGNAALEAASVAAILAVGNLFYSGTGPTGYVLSMTGRPGVNFANSISAVVLYVVLGSMVVPEHGAVGMAVVDSVVTALVNAARVLEAKILVGVQPFGKSFLKPVAATVIAAAVLLLWQLVPGDTVVLEIVGIVVAGVVYLVVLRALGLDPEERYVWDRIRARAARTRRAK
ncbi:MAG: polysaccharide biosynthesis C-terminal domain-containing protein, partial [Actinomycetota bacterium]|nr:polysaccharide biosynthesis C-terminal domain-containing protein [Actinomycetota bacterium]